MTNREIAVGFASSFAKGDTKFFKQYVVENFVHHNPFLATGLAPLLEAVAAVKQLSPKPTLQVLRTISEGDFVVLHLTYNFGEGEKVAIEVFRLANGKIVEQWDNVIDLKPANLSNRTQLDGPTEVKDLAKTAQNKQTVLDSQVALGSGDIVTAKKLMHPGYMQHNPDAGDGLAGLQQGLAAMAKRGEALKLGKIHHVIGEGNFVFISTEGFTGAKPAAIFDIFRLENDQLVEHWDVIAPIENLSQGAANQLGKF